MQYKLLTKHKGVDACFHVVALNVFYIVALCFGNNQGIYLVSWSLYMAQLLQIHDLKG